MEGIIAMAGRMEVYSAPGIRLRGRPLRNPLAGRVKGLPASATALIAACERWLSRRGLTGLRGPVNPDMNHSCGILIKGFKHPPAILMPYNAPYYQPLLEGAGLSLTSLAGFHVRGRRV